MPLGRVLDRNQMIADAADMAECADGLGGVLQQCALESRIGPGLGDDPRAVVRSDPGLVGLHDGVERRRIDIALLAQHRLQRAHAQFHLGKLRMVVVVVMMIGHVRRIIEIFCRCRDVNAASLPEWGMEPKSAALAAVLAISLAAGEARAANGAYAVDAADISEAGSCKVESWISTASNTDFSAVANPPASLISSGRWN